MATTKDLILINLSPSATAINTHMLLVSLQVYIWRNEGQAKPSPRPLPGYGCQRYTPAMSLFLSLSSVKFLQNFCRIWFVLVKIKMYVASPVSVLNRILHVTVFAVDTEMETLEMQTL